MASFKFENISIDGISVAVPTNKVDMASFASLYGEETVTKLIKSTGIQYAHRAEAKQTATDLGYSAAERLLKENNINRAEIGLLVFVTQSPDYRRPSSASVLHGKLGLSFDCAALEINLGCSGFVYGLQTILALMSCSTERLALLVLGETASKLTNTKDRSTNMLYGDAGAAILLKKEDRNTVIQGELFSDGGRYKSIILPAGGFRDMNPPIEEVVCEDGNIRSLYDIHMDGAAVFSFTITDVPDSIQSFLNKNQVSIDDFDDIVLHQANAFIIKQLIRKFKVPKEKVPVSLDRYGNTGGISIPLTIADKYGEKNEGIKRIFSSGFGVGLSWGIATFEMDTKNVLPVFETDYYDENGRLTINDIK